MSDKEVRCKTLSRDSASRGDGGWLKVNNVSIDTKLTFLYITNG